MGERANSRSGLSRREMMTGGAAALAGGLYPGVSHGAISSFEPATALGTVFEDNSGSGVRGSLAHGIPGVMVSNGRDVVLTDADGRYSLAVEPGDSLFVIKPAHFSLPSKAGCPSFSYLHQSTGSLPASIDFPLKRTHEPSKFDALLFADVQPSNAAELSYFNHLMRRGVHGTAAAFAINHGDVMGDDLSLFPAYRRVIDETGIPWHHCPGNHDMNLDSAGPQHAFETWKREIGPTHHAFQYAGATFILLNNVDYAGHGKSFASGRGYRGLIGEAQLSFVENVLRHVPRDNLVVVSMHIPLVSFEDPDSISDTTTDRRVLIGLLSGRPHTVSFAGHSHTTEHHYLGSSEGFEGADPHHHHVLTAASGAWWSGARDDHGIPVSDSRDGSPKGYHVLSVDGASYTTRFVPLSDATSAQMRVVLSSGGRSPEGVTHSPIGAAQLPSLSLVADVFDGGPNTKVVFEIEGGGIGPVEMMRTRMADPFIVESFARDKNLSKPWVKPSVSSHIWTAPLHIVLTDGSYRVVVRAIVESGQVHESALMLDVVA